MLELEESERPIVSPYSITLAEAKNRLRSGFPLCGQVVRGLFSKVIRLGAGMYGPSLQFMLKDGPGQWRLTKFPVVRRPEQYRDDHLRIRMTTSPSILHSWNVRRLLPKKEWDEISWKVIAAARHRCEVCGSQDGLHCHEVWEVDWNAAVQRLVRFQTLCRLCHAVVHIEFTECLAEKGRLNYNAVVEHFCKINGCGSRHFLAHRARILDLEGSLKRTLEPPPPPTPRQRSKKWVIDFGAYNDRVPKRARGPHWLEMKQGSLIFHHG